MYRLRFSISQKDSRKVTSVFEIKRNCNKRKMKILETRGVNLFEQEIRNMLEFLSSQGPPSLLNQMKKKIYDIGKEENKKKKTRNKKNSLRKEAPFE